ncbi:MAG: hypothetical protein HN661_12180 [Gammaproteobacteria bacterium]|jgi:hypothetical protein|nr:hypothetical protein [Gammaproteobacteria bacterium]MBT4132413.1 hypothetical protein [Candidatus Neomarinimicrobiota bacterium]MBT4300948.1 hypothetical protein [Gammaproteobacteria bacterium]MBT7139784.1 hypothetical protein [Gammaproteobacteria bacterium]MBT7480255.1 hypothetical protein [Gammaproteobacteria bacterium]
MSTPNFIHSAIADYMEGNPKTLIQMFNDGVPLQNYPETQELITKLLQDIPVRPAGAPPTRRTEEQRHVILALVAQLKGAGLGLINSGEKKDGSKSKLTACGIAGKVYELSGSQVYQSVWLKMKDSDEAKRYLEIGKSLGDDLIEIYKDYS